MWDAVARRQWGDMDASLLTGKSIFVCLFVCMFHHIM